MNTYARGELELPIFMDYHSTTPVDPRVLDAMLPFFNKIYGNPASKDHIFGWKASEAVEKARQQITSLFNARAKELIFTSGATESDNLALKGVAEAYQSRGKHIIISKIEHKAVLDTCAYLAKKGFEITYVPVDSFGIVDMDYLENAIRSDTILVSIIAANNEIGVVQPLEQIGRLCREKGVWFHTDAAQALGKIPLDVERMNIDLMSISAHKMYGPKGIGALYVRSQPQVRVLPLIHGGGHERKIRSGTLNTPGIVGFGEACRVAKQEMQNEANRLTYLRNKLKDRLLASLPETYVNGHLEQRLPGNLNVSFAYVEGEAIVLSLKDWVAVSSGSACSSASLKPSHVLESIGLREDLRHSAIRFGLGRFTTEPEVDLVAEKVIETVNRLRSFSPLWEMHRKGVDIRKVKWNDHGSH